MQKNVKEAFRVHYKWTVIEYAKVCPIAPPPNFFLEKKPTIINSY